MSYHDLSGRFAQFGGLAIALASGILDLGLHIRIPVISQWSQSSIANGATESMLLEVAGAGLFIFLVGVFVFAFGGENYRRNMRDLRKSGWK